MSVAQCIAKVNDTRCRRGEDAMPPVAGNKDLMRIGNSRNPVGMDRDRNPTTSPRLRIRVVFGEAGMIGPGKAELLERIDRCGSIAAAGREMGMSYKRAWQLIATLNAMFSDPVVDSTRGGPGGGGAVLTEAGREVVRLYRALEAEAEAAAAPRVTALHARLTDQSAPER